MAEFRDHGKAGAVNRSGDDETAARPQSLEQLREETRSVLKALVGPHRDVALLDFPNHQNVGDTMIWRGELDHLASLGLRVRYRTDIQRFSRELLDRLVPYGPILLHGGGNFGDLWPEFQRFRERIVSLYPNRRVIQLPQSIEFRDPAAAAGANAVFGQHDDFHLLVRDWQSHARARATLPDVQVQFCHDAALGWQPTGRGVRKDGATDVLVLARRDHERGVGINQFVPTQPGRRDRTADWGLRGVDRLLWRLARIPLGLARAAPVLASLPAYYPAMSMSYRALAELNLRDGLRLFRGSRMIATDRLHAHVLALLLRKPHVVADNNYGKIAGVMNASTGDLGDFLFVSSDDDVEAATKWLDERLQRDELR